jgi:putative Mn2+ efflux pump MntP
MSLESQIADLVSASNALVTTFTNKKNEITTAVNAAIAAIPSGKKIWFVDQVLGLDTNAGNVKETPFKTIDKAIASTPTNGWCVVMLTNDYVLDTPISVACSYLEIYGWTAITSGITPKLKAKYYSTNDNTITALGGFLLYGAGSNIEIRSCNIDLPSVTGVVPAPVTTRLNSFIKTNSGSSLPPIISVMLEALVVTKAADFYGALVGTAASAVVLGCSAVTFPGDMGGKYISSVTTPGTDPKTLNNVLTSLPSL